MQLKKALLTLALGLASTAVLAQTQVRQLDTDTLLVELQYGKPPHGRILIERDKDPAVFATFDEMRTQPRRNLFAGFFGGAPGKGHYPQAPRGAGLPTQETADFAQFEETREANAGTVQHWHGAPGKGPALK